MEELTAVDVVVPIYGAPDEVETCVESLLRNTDHPEARFVLADDASQDPRIQPVLERFSDDPRVDVIRNPSNLGFVRNCNQSMRRSTRDIVLLNSDTIVGPGWLRRLQTVAYQLERVGSVTPLSNNAEVCSSPWWFEPNRYPNSVGVEDIDALVSDLAIEGPIDLPTGVGFCLYLRRSALDVVGLFDEQAFGRGYGEENDLCARLRHSGFLNLLAPNVFVGHVGGSSFSGTGTLAENLEVVSERWPGYHRAVAAYRDAGPLRGVNSRIGIELVARFRDENAIRPLYVLHYRTRIGSKGGTEHHTEDLIDGAGHRLDPLVLTYEETGPVAQWDVEGAGTSFPAAVDHEDEESLAWLDRLLATGVDLVHVQHPKALPLPVLESLQRRARAEGMPVVWSLHDYYTFCSCVQMVHPDGSRCPTEGHCDTCLELAIEQQEVGLREWRERYGALVRQADLCICPSESAAQMQASLLNLENAPMVMPHGIDGPRTTLEPPRRELPRIVVLGYSAPQKGGHLARTLVEITRGEVEWVFLGRDHLEGVRRGRTVSFMGTYDRANLPSILERLSPDAIAILSNWDETYMYTLSEAWQLGIPVFASSVGALVERVGHSGGGVLIEHTDAPSAAREIVATLGDEETMRRLRSEAAEAGAALPTVEETATSYVEIYGELLGEDRNRPAVTHPDPSVSEWRGWIGSFPVPFPTELARPLRVSERIHDG